jgi:DNA-binding transcriptional LysR family regulator
VPDTLPDSSLICQPLGVIDSVLCATPRYIAAHGLPRSVDELSEHVCLQLTQPNFPTDRWRLAGPEGECDYPLPAGRFNVNMPEAMALALHEGVGIGPLPSLVVRNSLRTGALVKVLPEYRLHKLNVYAVYASRKYLDAKIKSWIDFAREWVTNETRPEHAAKPHARAAGTADGVAAAVQPAVQPAVQRLPRPARRSSEGHGSTAVAALPLKANGSPMRV